MTGLLRYKAKSVWGRKKALTFALAITLIAVVALGTVGYSAPQYPKPVGNVNDYCGVLSDDHVARLDALIDAVLEQTGVTFAIAIVKDHGDEDFRMYAANLYERWGIGGKDEHKGLLVLLSMKDRDLCMEVGYGLEAVITDGRAGECLDKMVPYFRLDKYGEGLYEGLWKAAQYAADDAGVKLVVKTPNGSQQSPRVDPYRVPWWGFLVPALIAGMVARLAVRKKRCPACKARLNVTDRVIQGATYALGGLAVKTLYCPRCGYKKEEQYKTPKIMRPGGGGASGPGPFMGGGLGRGLRGGGSRRTGGFSGPRAPRGFGGGRSGGGGAGRKW